jgi:COMPASS component SPP1
MLQLLDMASKRRDLALTSGTATKDLCGYDPRLDAVGAPVPFRAFLQSPHGEAIFSAGKLGPPPPDYEIYPPLDTTTDALMAGMCARKKCKPHGGWNALLVKNVRHRMKELAAQARELALMEERVRRSAAGRFQRRRVEENTVEVFDSEDDLEMGG